jgi:RHS repeat-associated protein
LLWKLNSGTLANFGYQLGPTGNRKVLQEVVGLTSPVNRTNTWSYDTTFRLTNETVTTSSGPTGSLTYGLDDVGNRVSRGGSGSITNTLSPQSSTVGTNDWLNSDGYDSDGNTTTNAGIFCRYDYADRLTNFNNGAVLITYGADGNRIKKVTASSTNLYLVATVNPTGYPQVVEELTISGTSTNLSRQYSYGVSLISQRVPGGSTYFLAADGHCSTRLLLDNGGNVTNAFAYDAFGTLVFSNTISQTAYLYCGEQFDSEMDSYYLRARYLNPNIGRFWTMDSCAGSSQDPLSLHKYIYSHVDPINNIDPTGLNIIKCARNATHGILNLLSLNSAQHEYLWNDIAGEAYEMDGTALKAGPIVAVPPKELGPSDPAVTSRVIAGSAGKEDAVKASALAYPSGAWIPGKHDCQTMIAQVLSENNLPNPWIYGRVKSKLAKMGWYFVNPFTLYLTE